MDKDLVVEKVGEVLEYIDRNSGYINNIDANLIRFIPTYIWKTRITARCIEDLWDHLSDDKKSELLLYQPCHYHFNKRVGRTECEGSAPAIIRCYQCKETFI